jgi:hypothetical protein
LEHSRLDEIFWHQNAHRQSRDTIETSSLPPGYAGRDLGSGLTTLADGRKNYRAVFTSANIKLAASSSLLNSSASVIPARAKWKDDALTQSGSSLLQEAAAAAAAAAFAALRIASA